MGVVTGNDAIRYIRTIVVGSYVVGRKSAKLTQPGGGCLQCSCGTKESWYVRLAKIMDTCVCACVRLCICVCVHACQFGHTFINNRALRVGVTL